MKVRLKCSYKVEAAHQLWNDEWSKEKNFEIFGKCANLHGHQWTIDLNFIGDVPEGDCMLMNGYAIEDIVRPFLDENFDHKCLNHHVEFFKKNQPTCELIAYWLYNELKDRFPAGVTLETVRIWEMPEISVEYPAV
ncbi:MAG: 6-carboxytetrahydropterin synthase [Deltaproteobacteria bacterium]|nr:6-carboxytetrahydropterin synthase [Deltaproteobacteria bacterium]